MALKDIFRNINLTKGNDDWETIKIKFPLLKKIKAAIKSNNQIDILLVDFTDFTMLEIKTLQSYIMKYAKITFYPGEVISIQKLGQDLFVLYLSHTSSPDIFDLKMKIRDFRESVLNKINNITGVNPRDIPINIGRSTLDSKNLVDIEISLFNCFKQAFLHSAQEYDWEKEKLTKDFVKIVARKDFKIVYQPLVSLNSTRIFGYEALTRGPENNYFHYPDNLFSFAEKVGLLLQLERVTRELAIKKFNSENTNHKLFLNMNPMIINDPSFAGGETLRLIKRFGLLPQNIVFEITERTAITDFDSFKKTILHYREQGFMIAIDDAGAGYSSLQSIAELKPDFIKVDKSLVRDIDKDMVKKSLLETFVTFADKINSKILAEGIETEDEMKVLMGMGVEYGQGYFLARPGYPLPLVENNALQVFRNFYRSQPDLTPDSYIHLGKITQEIKCINKETRTKEVTKYFSDNEHARAVAVVEYQQPIGLIMRDKLFQQLSNQYGVALYLDKPVSLVMDPNPLIIEDRQPLIIASEIAANRNPKKLYDDILVTNDHKLLGTVSVQKMLNTLHK